MISDSGPWEWIWAPWLCEGHARPRSAEHAELAPRRATGVLQRQSSDKSMHSKMGMLQRWTIPPSPEGWAVSPWNLWRLPIAKLGPLQPRGSQPAYPPQMQYRLKSGCYPKQWEGAREEAVMGCLPTAPWWGGEHGATRAQVGTPVEHEPGLHLHLPLSLPSATRASCKTDVPTLIDLVSQSFHYNALACLPERRKKKSAQQHRSWCCVTM